MWAARHVRPRLHIGSHTDTCRIPFIVVLEFVRYTITIMSEIRTLLGNVNDIGSIAKNHKTRKTVNCYYFENKE